MDFRVFAFTSHEKQSELMVRSLYQIGHIQKCKSIQIESGKVVKDAYRLNSKTDLYHQHSD